MEVLSASLMLQLVEDLISSKNAEELLLKLRLGIKPIVDISHVLVLAQTKQRLVSIASSEELSETLSWQENELLNQVFEKHVLLTQLSKLPMDWPCQNRSVNSSHVLLVAINFAGQKGLFVLFLAEHEQSPTSIETAINSALTVFRQGFIQLSQQQHAYQLINDRTYALRESQQRFEAFAQLASDWFWETDESLCFTYLSLNEVEQKPSIFKNFLNKSPLNFRSDRETQQLKKWEHFLYLIRQYREIHDFEFEALNDEGHRVWISISGKAKFNRKGDYVGYIGIGKDISFAKQRERDLSHAKDKAESANKAKSHFLAVMSHEIRTPMNAILGTLELLEDTEPSERQQELVDFMRSSTELLRGVISDTLDFAKIESGTLSLERSEVNLFKLINNLVHQFETQALKKGIHFSCVLGNGVPEHIICDGVRLSQILLNLLGNAFKFTLEGEVCLNVNRSDTGLLISVNDTGVGIAEEHIGTLFEPFSQLHDKQVGRQQGVGLGLSITKRLLELMQGGIICNSEVGRGTEFVVTMPIELVDKKVIEAKESTQANQNSSYKILVAEDNQANQFIIKAILEKRNHSVTIVENGELAVASAKAEHFDLVLMDMVMPVMDGVTSARKIRDALGENAPPIIALTANAGLADKTKCLNAGMKDVLTKPLNSALLDERIRALFS